MPRTTGKSAFVTAFIGLSASAAMAEAWPDLPVGIKNGISAQVGDTIYVGLGSAGSDLYALKLTEPARGWVKQAAFTGPATNGAAAAVSNGRIFVFSGNGKATADARSPVIFDTVHSYDPAADKWARIETRTPAGLSGAKALPLSDGRIALIGGYNKELFDKYLADVMTTDKDKDPAGFKKLVDTYMGMQPRDYRWNDKVLVYDPAGNKWETMGENPYLPNCDSALAPAGKDAYLLISGEIKPGLRTAEVKSVSFKPGAAAWNRLPDMPAISASEPQEGVAGAYAASVGDAVLVAGGANFRGARANAEAGRWFAHEGLKKAWRSDVFALIGGQWKAVGELPRGLAYGASFPTATGMLVVGGEDGEGKPRSEVFLLQWDGKSVSIVN